jgi:hypothetical protein
MKADQSIQEPHALRWVTSLPSLSRRCRGYPSRRILTCAIEVVVLDSGLLDVVAVRRLCCRCVSSSQSVGESIQSNRNRNGLVCDTRTPQNRSLIPSYCVFRVAPCVHDVGGGVLPSLTRSTWLGRTGLGMISWPPPNVVLGPTSESHSVLGFRPSNIAHLLFNLVLLLSVCVNQS